MPPKKDNKKKGAASGPKEVDLESYVREPFRFSEISAEHIARDEPLSGQVYYVSTQFAEWNIADENWSEPIPPESLLEIQYPPVIKYSSNKPIKDFLGLNEEAAGATDKNAKGAKKEAPKKGKAVEVASEAAYDETGRALPRVFVDKASLADPQVPPDENEHKGFGTSRGFLQEGPVSVAEGSISFMTEVDPLLCAAFKTIARFSDTLTANAECPYLWRAIYPQLPDGRPYYNASGRYCVKMYLAGRWRKVYVNDDVPVTDSGAPAVAASSVPQELWPTLLAKAVYTVYTACGYNKVFSTLGLPHAAPSATDIASAFLSFSVHVLTGWLPTAPMAIPADSPEESGSFLQDIVFGGCRCISTSEKIRSSALSTTEIVVDESKYQGKLTAKILRDLEETKLVKREHLKRVICKREADIRATSSALSSVHGEIFCFVLTNPEGTLFRVYPILSIASNNEAPLSADDYIPGSPTSTRLNADSSGFSPVKPSRPPVPKGTANPSTAQLLVEWSLDGVRPSGLSDGTDEGCDSEWINSTEIKQKWIPFSEFCGSMSKPDSVPEAKSPYGVSVVSFETRSRTSESQFHHRAWIVKEESVADTTGKAKPPAKGKESKKGGASEIGGVALTPLGAPVSGSDAGIFPPTLLHIDASSFIEKMKADSSHSAFDVIADNKYKKNDVRGAAADAKALSEEAADSTMSASDEIKNSSDETSASLHENVVAVKPDPNHYLALMIFLQGDILSSIDGEHVTRLADSDATRVVLPLMADDAVLVLQEIRIDDEEPLVMRVALNRSTLITPITRTTFHIPSSRLLHGSNEGKLTFWVRLFTKASVLMSFASSCPLKLGPAEAVWAEAGEGLVSITEGETSILRSDVENVLFRASYLATALANEGAAIEKKQHVTSSCVNSNRVMAFLYITDRRANQFVSLLEMSGNFPEVCTSLPKVDGNILTLTPAASVAGPLEGQLSVSLVARCYTPMGSSVLNGFKWKLLLLSRKELPLTTRWVSLPAPSGGPNIPASLKRYTGAYTPNNRLVLFRDKITGVLQDAPLAVRISILPFQSESSPGSPDSVWFVVRLIHPTTRVVIREYRGRGIVPLYALDLKQFVEAEGQVAPGSPVKGSKKDEKKGGKGVATEETVDFIMECTLDEKAMNIPISWRSKFPYTFSSLFPSSLLSSPADLQKTASQASIANDGQTETPKYIMPEGAIPPEPCGPHWALDIVGGSVTTASHDTYDLVRFNNIKNTWLEKSGDRFDRGVAAVTYNAARIANPGTEAEDEIVGLLSSALGVSAEVLKPTESLIPEVPKYTEHVTKVSEGKVPAIVPPKSEEQTEQLLQETLDLDNDAQSSMDALAALNSLLRDEVAKKMQLVIENAEKNSNELRATWHQRENARKLIETKNSSLTFILDRVAEAKSQVFAPTEDSSKKGAKGKKK